MLVFNELVLAAAGPTGRYYRMNTEYWSAANIGAGPTTPTNIPSGPHTNIPAVQYFVLLRYSHTSSSLPKKMWHGNSPTLHTQSLYGLKPIYREACAPTNASSSSPPTGTGPAGQTGANRQ